MTSNSLEQQIRDAFMEELAKEGSIDKALRGDLKDYINAGKHKKEEILALLKEEKPNENP